MLQKDKIRVGIVERNHVFRERLAGIIRSQNDMVVAFSISEFDGQLNPADIILLQWEASYSPLFQQQNNAGIKPKGLVFNADVKRQGFVSRLRCGTRGFILPHSTEEGIVDAIRTLMETGWVIPSSVGAKISSEIVQGTQDDFETGLLQNMMLSGRERQILRLILEGLTNGEIAEKLNLATSTIKNHVHEILNKSKRLGFCKRTDLIFHLRGVKNVLDGAGPSLM